MRLIRVLATISLAGLAACESTSSPGGPSSGDLDGQWGWQWNGNPGGSYMSLTLSTAGTSVTGTGGVCGIGPNCSPGSVTITGEHVPGFGPFTLTIKGGGGYGATYAGQFKGKDQLEGTWTEGSQSNSVIFNRCTSSSFC
jgi:hypothetical protein